MRKLTLAYFGTPDFSARFLEKLLTDSNIPVEVVLVVTQPDKPVGRKQIMTKSPVKLVAGKYNIQVIDRLSETGVEMGGIPTARNSSEHWREGQSKQDPFHTCDIALLLAYGEMIPKKLLSIPKLGFWNIHPSLLPKYRGASPIAYPLMLGDTETGVTLMQMDEKMDHGPIIAQKKVPIEGDEKRTDLEKKLTEKAFEMLKQLLIETGVEAEGHPASAQFFDEHSWEGQPKQAPFHRKPQDHTLATYTRTLTREDGFIPLANLQKMLRNDPISPDELPAIIRDYVRKYNPQFAHRNSSTVLYNFFRAFYPWPGIWTLIDRPSTWVSERRAPMSAQSRRMSWRALMGGANDRTHVLRLKITEMKRVGPTNVQLTKVQLEGKKEVDFKTFNRAYPDILCT